MVLGVFITYDPNTDEFYTKRNDLSLKDECFSFIFNYKRKFDPKIDNFKTYKTLYDMNLVGIFDFENYCNNSLDKELSLKYGLARCFGSNMFMHFEYKNGIMPYGIRNLFGWIIAIDDDWELQYGNKEWDEGHQKSFKFELSNEYIHYKGIKYNILKYPVLAESLWPYKYMLNFIKKDANDNNDKTSVHTLQIDGNNDWDNDYMTYLSSKMK